MHAAGVLMVLVLATVMMSGCIFDDPPPQPVDPRVMGYTIDELQASFNRTTDRVIGLEDLGAGALVVLEVVPEDDPVDLWDVVAFPRPLDEPDATTPRNFCGEFRSPTSMWGAASTHGALVVRQPAAPDAEVRYEAPQPGRFDGVRIETGFGGALRPYFVLFGVDDVAAWQAAGADAWYGVEGGAVWWRIVETGRLSCAFQPADHDEGDIVQNHLVTSATGLRSTLEVEQGALELLWRADRLHVEVAHNGTRLFQQTEQGGGGRFLAPLDAGAYEVRYDDVERVAGAAYAGFVLREIDASLVATGDVPYWSHVFGDDSGADVVSLSA